MEAIDNLEWFFMAIFAVIVVVNLYMVISVQPDMSGPKMKINDDDEAARVFVELINKTNQQILIHDDGNKSSSTIYNRKSVTESVRDRIKSKDIEVHCLFNDNESTDLRDLAQSDEFKNNIKIWHLNGDRPENDVHYKIVDGGKLVHVSKHDHGDTERSYYLYEIPGWAIGTRKRVAGPYTEHFRSWQKSAVQV